MSNRKNIRGNMDTLTRRSDWIPGAAAPRAVPLCGRSVSWVCEYVLPRKFFRLQILLSLLRAIVAAPALLGDGTQLI